MNKSQKIVAMGAVSGIVSMLLAVCIITSLVPPFSGMEDPVRRVLLALVLNVFAVVPLFVMIAAVGNARFMSDAIDPLKHKENKDMEVDGRVVDNTLQQNFVFFVGTLALATVLPSTATGVLVAVTIVYIVARFAFWFGYRKNPLYRAPGMAATSYLNLGIIIATIVLFFL